MVVVSKFTYGAWVPVVVIPLIVLLFLRIHRHYVKMDTRLAAAPGEKVRRRTNTVVVLVGRVTKGSLTAIAYARSLNPDRLVAVTVVSNPEEQERITQQWEDHQIPVELRALYSPYRELTRPIMAYIDELDAITRRRLRDRRGAGVRARSLVAAVAPQPERTACCGPGCATGPTRWSPRCPSTSTTRAWPRPKPPTRPPPTSRTEPAGPTEAAPQRANIMSHCSMLWGRNTTLRLRVSAIVAEGFSE